MNPKCNECAFNCPEVIQSLLILSNMVCDVCNCEDVTEERKIRVKTAYQILEKSTLDKCINRECICIII